MAKSTLLSARVPAPVKKKLAKLAEATDRPIGWHVNQALVGYVDVNAWHVMAIKEGLAQARAGAGIPAEDVERWVASWGTRRELSKPKARRLR
jgi:predicted transcriptional regulator